MLKFIGVSLTLVTMLAVTVAFGQPQTRLRPDAKPAATAPKVVLRPDPALAVERARPILFARKSKELLIRELAGLERVLARTSERSPDFPILLRRLAEGYAELEAKAERERAAAQAAADALAEAERKAPRRVPKSRSRGSGTVM